MIQNVLLNYYFYAQNIRQSDGDICGKKVTLLHADLEPVTAGNRNTI